MQIAKRNLSDFHENSVISIRIEIFRRLNALSTPFYTPNAAQTNFSVEIIPKIAKRNLSNFDEISVISSRIEISMRINALSTPFYTPNVPQTNFSVEIIPEIAKRNLSDFDENSVISFQIEISQRLNGLSTPFLTPNVAQTNFSVEIVPENRKTQSFRFRRKLCYFVPERDLSALERSFHSISYAERSATQFQRRNNPCKSRNVIFQISTKTLLFRS
jgi:hypothetical protein